MSYFYLHPTPFPPLYPSLSPTSLLTSPFSVPPLPPYILPECQLIPQNKCKDWANSLKNSQVSVSPPHSSLLRSSIPLHRPSPSIVMRMMLIPQAAFDQCDAQLAACPNGSTKRDVVNRYAKRGVLAF